MVCFHSKKIDEFGSSTTTIPAPTGLKTFKKVTKKITYIETRVLTKVLIKHVNCQVVHPDSEFHARYFGKLMLSWIPMLFKWYEILQNTKWSCFQILENCCQKGEKIKLQILIPLRSKVLIMCCGIREILGILQCEP